MQTKSSTEYGWLSISRSEYESMVRHGYAGKEIGSGTYWAMAQDETGATCLYKGVTIDESR